jgi:hypothetical protein
MIFEENLRTKIEEENKGHAVLFLVFIGML